MRVFNLFFISLLVLLLPGFQPETDKQVIAVQALFREEIGIEFYDVYKEVKSAMEQKGIQARLPFTLTIK